MKKKLRTGIIIFFAGFVVFFIFRLLYGYTAKPEYIDERQTDMNITHGTEIVTLGEVTVKNYASRKVKIKELSTNQIVSVDQKYEKIANITTQTHDFEGDEKQIKTLIDKYDALIQYELNAGRAGFRRLKLDIGVNPAHFDTMVSQVKQIGKLTGIQINKTDKTNEYKNLTAKKFSLEKTRNSLVELKKRGGSIEEMIKLESRILEIEQQIQSLGVSLGNYDAENEFCTISFSLSESTKPITISFVEHLKNSLEWTVKYYALFLVILLLILICTYIAVLVIGKIIDIYKESNDSATNSENIGNNPEENGKK